MKRFLLLILLLRITTAFGAQVDSLDIYSPSMQKTIRTIVILPDAATPDTPCPTIYLLHGHGNDATAWLRIRPDLPAIADRDGIAFVCPDAGNSWYLDSPVRKEIRYETFITDELIPAVEGSYPLIDRRTARAITGLSMGGFGAVSLAIKHKELFGAAGSTSGGLDIRPFPDSWGLSELLGTQAENPAAWEAATPINLIPRLKPGDLALIIDCGWDDFFAEGNEAFHNRLREAGIDHDYYVRPGGHNHAYWNNSIAYQILFFADYFSRAAKPE